MMDTSTKKVFSKDNKVGKKRIFSARLNKNEQTRINSARFNRPIREKHYFSNLITKYSQNLISKPNKRKQYNSIGYAQCDRIQRQYKQFFHVNELLLK